MKYRFSANVGPHRFHVVLQDPVEEKIWTFGALEPGWNWGEGSRFEKRTLWRAISLHKILRSQGYVLTDAFPGVDGEVRVTAYEGDAYFEFTLEADGTWTFVSEESGKETKRLERLSQNEVEEFVGKFRVCSTSACSPLLNTGTVDYTDFKVWRLDQVGTEEFPFLTLTARSDPPGAYVATSLGSMGHRPIVRQYFGNSTTPFFLEKLRSEPNRVAAGTRVIETSLV